MKSSRITRTAIGVMVAFLLGMWCLPVYGEDQRRAELVAKIREKIENLELVRSQIREQRTTFRQEQQRIEAQINKLRQQLTETQESIGHKHGYVQTEEGRHDSVRQVNLQKEIAASAAGLYPLAGLIETVIQRQPYRERTVWLEQLNKVKVQCRSDTLHEQLSSMQILFDVADEILPHLDTVQLSNEPVGLADGRVVHGYVLRLGMLSSMFVSEDGRVLGIAHRNPAGGWLYDVPRKKADAARTAIAIVRRKATPALATVPLQLIKTDGSDE
ncbi:MAG: DUF3450 family protein [Candidatus Loosdrechtia sp.]|uniref:DUF3450 family protein n=1 Tax=Candidatus Loosdrechtia sp. TaxID=3101272 RepID=UPI003A652C28|nr:MAG: DUF3450 family protein [Candidatus Jettenia sp. AMX2]